jgi:hypothetical protein
VQPLNPGYLKTQLQRHVTGMQSTILGFFLQPPINGAYTMMFAGLSDQVTPNKSGAYGTSIPYSALRFADFDVVQSYPLAVSVA